MKGIFAAIIVIIVVTVTVFASATDLRVQGGTIQAGWTRVSLCDELLDDGACIAGYYLNPDNGLVDTVCIGCLDNEVFGLNLEVCLLNDDSPLVCGEYLNIDSSEVCVTLDCPVLACAITGVRVTIN